MLIFRAPTCAAFGGAGFVLYETLQTVRKRQPMKRDRKPEEWTQRRIQSIEVGFQVLRAMEAAEGSLPLRDIAATAGMPASKAHLYLVSFVREGVAFQDPETGYYGLGRFAIQLGLSAIRQLDVVELGREELTRVQQATGLAAYLSLWGDRGPGIVSKVDGQRQGSLAVRLGYVLPLLSSATGQVFLSHLDERETKLVRDEELAAGRKGIVGVSLAASDLPSLIEQVRNQGYAMTTNSINMSFAAISAPVFGFDGRIAAAMTVLGSDKSLAGTKKKQVTTALLDSSRRLSGRMGFSERRSVAKGDVALQGPGRRRRPQRRLAE